MNISHIVAMTPSGGIGINNTLPWHDPEEMKIFRTLTMGKTVFMGRTTYESLPDRKPYKELGDNDYYQNFTTKALKGRTNVVVSKSMAEGKEYTFNKHNGVYVTKDLKHFNYETSLLDSERFVIGGASLYVQTIDLTDMIYVSRMKEDYECDTFYPVDELKKFTKLSTIKHGTFDLEIYKRQ